MKQIKTNDLILDAIVKKNGIYGTFYTLVCRADKRVPNQWNLTPETDITVTYLGEKDYCIFEESIRQVMQYQAVRYPQIDKIREGLKSEIDQFNAAVRATSAGTKFQKIK